MVSGEILSFSFPTTYPKMVWGRDREESKMKQKIIGIFMVMLVIAGYVLPVIGAENKLNEKNMETEFSISFSRPTMNYIDDKLTLAVAETNSIVSQQNKPVLPVYKKTIVYPYDTHIQSIMIIPSSSIQQQPLPTQVKCAPEVFQPGMKDLLKETYTKMKTEVQSAVLYPESWYDYSISYGLYDGQPSLIVNLILYPIRIACDNMYYVSGFHITIDVQEHKVMQKPTMEDALLIIAPQDFSDHLEEFVDHKESKGIATTLVNLESIYDGMYFPVEGRDDAEKVKYFIKNAYENWGIKYVLLVGGRKPGIAESYYVPVRYVHVSWGENRYISDLYYADIYNADYSFSTWDTDENNVFCQWPYPGMPQDEVDLYPEVFIGRWPCRNIFELQIIIQKTIDYENMHTQKNIVLVGGDNFEPAGIEGEIVCDKSMQYLTDFTYEKVYASEIDVNPETIREGLGTGAMFLHMHGHGSPTSWKTHPPNSFDVWTEGISIFDLPWLSNEEYPIILLGGCHTAMFNVSLFNRPWLYGWKPSPEGIGWWFARKLYGGGIATLGYTCFPVATHGESGDLDGDGVNESDCVESGYGFMQLQVLKGYGVEHHQFLGECWGYAISTYLEAFKIHHAREHFHTIQGFILLGDPSLKIGGYT